MGMHIIQMVTDSWREEAANNISNSKYQKVYFINSRTRFFVYLKSFFFTVCRRCHVSVSFLTAVESTRMCLNKKFCFDAFSSEIIHSIMMANNWIWWWCFWLRGNVKENFSAFSKIILFANRVEWTLWLSEEMMREGYEWQIYFWSFRVNFLMSHLDIF